MYELTKILIYAKRTKQKNLNMFNGKNDTTQFDLFLDVT